MKKSEHEVELDAPAKTSHYENSQTAMELAREIWHTEVQSYREGSCAHSADLEGRQKPPEKVDEALAAARASQREATSMARRVAGADRDASMRSLTSATAADVDKWLAALKEKRNAEGRRVCNDKQFEAVALVARRVQQELIASADPSADFGEPLRWLVHGGPGTGKSHVI